MIFSVTSVATAVRTRRQQHSALVGAQLCASVEHGRQLRAEKTAVRTCAWVRVRPPQEIPTGISGCAAMRKRVVQP